jgi:hypothetical protein
LKLGFESFQITNHPQSNLIPMKAFNLTLQQGNKQGHQPRHFIGWATPVFRTKGEQGEVSNPLTPAIADKRSHTIDTFFMTRNPWKTPCSSPTTVAIHDDSHMPWHIGRLRDDLRGTMHSAPKKGTTDCPVHAATWR